MAAEAEASGNKPFAALAVAGDGSVVAEAVNREGAGGDVTEHAELRLLRTLSTLDVAIPTLWIVVNAEPCSMCSSALVKAKVGGIAYGDVAARGMDPWLPIHVVLQASTHRPLVVGPIRDG
jgi:tRNA(adenine34) deaminase